MKFLKNTFSSDKAVCWKMKNISKDFCLMGNIKTVFLNEKTP